MEKLIRQLIEEGEETFGLSVSEFEAEMDELYPTPDLKRAYDQMQSVTITPERDTMFKRLIATELRIFKNETGISPEAIKNNPAVYVGSGTDINLPLLLGAREIYMVDPDFDDIVSVQELIESITRVTGGDFPEPTGDNGWKFNFNFGDGNEEVKIYPRAEYYGTSDDIPADNRFDPPEKIGLLLAFRHIVRDMPESYIDKDPRAVGAVVDGGMILSYPAHTNFAGGYEEAQDKSDFDYYRSLKDGWKNRGFKTIPLLSLPLQPVVIKQK